MVGEWEALTLREAGVSLTDCDHRTPPAAEAGYPYVAIPQLRGGRIEWKDARRISPGHFAEWTRKAKPTANDVVLSRRCNPGETAFVPPGVEFALGQNLVLLRADGTRVHPPFLRWLAQGPQWWEQIGKFINVGAVFDSLKCADVPKFELIIPPLAEQRAIAHILGTLDDKIELNRRRNQTLEAMARALFKDWFVDFGPVRAKMEAREPYLPADLWNLFPDRLDDEGKPEGWRIMPVLEVLDLQGGSQPPAKEFVSEPQEGYVRLLQIRDFGSDAHVTYVPQTKKLRLVVEDDILIGRYGSASGNKSKDSLGRICRGLAGAYNVALMKVVPILVGREFCLQVLDDERFYGYLQGVSSKAVQSGFSKQELAQYQLALPPGELADEFERFGLSIYERQKKLRKESNFLAQLRDTLLPKLISGELRIADAETFMEERAQ